jgi:hypothetical protein
MMPLPKINFEQLCAEGRWAGDFFRTHAKPISEFLESKGFQDLEFVGKGSYAAVVAPKDNPNIVLRIFQGDAGSRTPIPYMLQAIGKRDIPLGGSEPDCLVEVLKRLDMDVAPPDIRHFLTEAGKHGSGVGSLGRGAEVGYYDYIADGAKKEWLWQRTQVL